MPNMNFALAKPDFAKAPTQESGLLSISLSEKPKPLFIRTFRG
jgi:hypothetical protein